MDAAAGMMCRSPVLVLRLRQRYRRPAERVAAAPPWGEVDGQGRTPGSVARPQPPVSGSSGVHGLFPVPGAVSDSPRVTSSASSMERRGKEPPAEADEIRMTEEDTTALTPASWKARAAYKHRARRVARTGPQIYFRGKA